MAAALAVVFQAAVGRLNAQAVTSGFVYAGGTFGSIDGAGRFGVGVDFRLAPHFDLGGELGLIAKHDVGALGSGNLTFHFIGRREGFDPFLVGGVSAARLAGTSGLYMNLGIGTNYWMSRKVALRGEFKGYAGGQDLGGFSELRFGVTFRP